MASPVGSSNWVIDINEPFVEPVKGALKEMFDTLMEENDAFRASVNLASATANLAGKIVKKIGPISLTNNGHFNAVRAAFDTRPRLPV